MSEALSRVPEHLHRLDLSSHRSNRRTSSPATSGVIPEHWPKRASSVAGCDNPCSLPYFQRMGLVRAAIVLGLVALSASACGSGRHVTFPTSYQTCGLSVGLPRGFHHRFWNVDGGGGITIGDGTRGLTDPAE